MQMFSFLRERISAMFSADVADEGTPTSARPFLMSINVVLGVILLFSGSSPLLSGSFDFFSISLLFLLLSFYRPGWMFLLLVGMLPYETVNLTGAIIGVGLRPYQLLAAALAIALAALFALRRSSVPMFRWRWFDTTLLLLPVGGLLGAINAPDTALSTKLAVILGSFFLLYVLGRLFIRDVVDLSVIAPFFLSSALLVAVYGIFQNVRFLFGVDPLEVMPGRPNATFPEPDWFGGFLVVVLAASFAMVMFPKERSFGSIKYCSLVFLAISIVFLALLLTVSRSAWLGMFAAGVVMAVGLAVSARGEWKRLVFPWAGMISIAFFVALAVAPFLTRFDLFGRAASTGGLQEITVACDSTDTALPRVLHDMEELTQNGCRHIDLEMIDVEKDAGKYMTTVFRPDPNVEIRKDIYRIAWKKIAEHPLSGIGWGSIGVYLGTDERGASLNASSIFLEVWLGSGILGFLGFLAVWIAIPILVIRKLLRAPAYESSTTDRLEAGLPNNISSLFILSAWAGLLVFNLFNSGILLGYFWISLAAVVLVLEENKKVSKLKS